MLEAGALDRRCEAALAPTAPRRVQLRPGGWDAHAHVIGNPAEWPFVAARFYTPPPASLASYLNLLDVTGLQFGVLVQVSVHGTDNGCMLTALRAAPERLRGIAVVDPSQANGTTLRDWQSAGVVGLRLATMGGGIGFEQLENSAAICAEMGWHLQLCGPAARLIGLRRRLSTLDVPISIEHMGFCAQPEARAERETLTGVIVDSGAYLKLSAAFRLSRRGPPYLDVAEAVHAFAARLPDRLLWGSDWPHVGVFDRKAMPMTGDLLDALAAWELDAALLHRIMVTNPNRLYGSP